ncbi:MAG: alpha/beta fold hydrolase [Ilumatobacteraceae bacterium]
MRIASTDGVELQLHDLGGSGPVLIISHATGFCAGPYRPLAALLAERFRVWALDYRGHGDSTMPSHGSLEWTGMGDDFMATLDAVADGPVVAVGHSMGGAAALMAACRRPEAFAGIYGFEPIVPNADPAASADPANPADPGVGGDPTAMKNNMMATAARRRRPSFGSKAEALKRYASPAARPPAS